MIIDNRHTAKGIISDNPFEHDIQTNDENFHMIVDLYNQSSLEKKKALEDLFSLDFSNIIPLSYTTNKFGFRSPYQYWFNEAEDSMWVFGDSLSYGHGLNVENTWAYKLAAHYNLKLYNFSCCGAGIDTAIRLLHSWISNSHRAPKIIVSYGFYRNRYETQFLKVTPTKYVTKYSNFYDETENEKLYKQKLEYYLSLMNSVGCPYVHSDFLSPTNGWHNFYQDFAMDIPIVVLDILKNTNHKKYDLTHFSSVTNLPHPGIKSNQLMFEHIRRIVDMEILKKPLDESQKT